MITRLVVSSGVARYDTFCSMFDQEEPVSPAPMTLLSTGVPLTLLLDLFLGPQSEDLLTHERSSAD